MSTESATLEPPSVISAPAEDFSAAAAVFEDAMGRGKESPAKAETPPAKTEAPPEPPAKQAPTSDAPDIPEEILTGEKPAAKMESPEDDVLSAEPPANLSKLGAADWVKLRDAARASKLEAEKLRKEIEAVKTKAPAVDEASLNELKTYREKVAEMEQRLERADFQNSPKFQAFIAREKTNLDNAKSYLEGTEIDASVIDRAASLAGAKRLEALKNAGLDAEQISAVVPYLANVDGIAAQKNEALANHKQLQEEWAAQEKLRAEERKVQERAADERVFREVGAKVSSEFTPFQKVEGYDKWNAQVDKLANEAKEFFSGNLPMEKVAEIAYYGVGAKTIHDMWKTQREQLKAARAEIAQLKAGQPTLGEQPQRSASEDANADPFERAAREFDRQMGRA